MFLFLPITFELKTSMSYKRVIRKLDGEMTEFKPSLNVLSTGKFMKNHKLESLYYGRREGEDFQLYYHTAKKRDGGDTGFFGHIEKAEGGTRIYGKFRKPIYTYVFGIIWLVLTILSALTCLAIKQNVGAGVCAGLCLAGLFLLFWDSKKKFLLSFLRSFPEPEDDSGE